MDIVQLKKQYGDRITLMGNLDCGELLTNGKPGQIVAETRRIIRHVSPGGAHIFGSSNSIHDAVPVDNLMVMLDAVRCYGQYPIQS
jgi:uroporphyrinogen decarboxylase